ncbi:MAG: RNA methyltransferase [Oscillospiraceae bacterium]
MAQFIKSRENDKIKNFIKLRDKAAFRKEHKLFTVEGLKLCLDIAAVLQPIETYCTQDVLEAEREIELLPGEHYIVSDDVAEKISEVKSPQGLFCVFERTECEINDIIKGSYVILENVQDPANVGTILRSAAAFGYKGAILCGACADVYSGKALRASMGAILRLDIIIGSTVAQTVAQLKKCGITSFAACLENSVPLLSIDALTVGNVGIVIGNEGKGLTSEAIEACDKAVRIPISSKVESLNAAAAASGLLWHFKGGELV